MTLPFYKSKRQQKFAEIAKAIATITIASALSYGVVRAGSLTPSSTPAATGYTLNDIYKRLASSTSSTEGNHSLSTSTSPLASMRSLTEIYSAITLSNFNAVNTQGPLTGDGCGDGGTCTDSNTGLIWGPVNNSATALSSASSSCTNNDEEFPGTGWHIPSVDEWKSVMDFTVVGEGASIIILPGASGTYWTSTLNQTNGDNAGNFQVQTTDLSGTGIMVGVNTGNLTNRNYVCVRNPNI